MTNQSHAQNGTGERSGQNSSGQNSGQNNEHSEEKASKPGAAEAPHANGTYPPSRSYAQIVGWGYHVPSRVITNRDLEQIVDTQDEWIRSRTGIEERHVAASPQETSASLGILATRKALDMADIRPSKVDLIICATSSPEHVFPSTASIIQDGLGATNAGAFDLSAACSGFVYGLSMARGHILAGDAEYVLVVGAETLSRLVDWTDRGTCILFGDGAGAVLVAASDVPGGIMASVLGSDGSGADLLTVPAGGSAMPSTLETVSSGSHYIKMDGRAVFRFATRVMADATRQVLERAGLTVDDVDLVIPHQANRRIIQNSVLKQLKIPEEKVFINLQKYGNTSTASIPIALCEAIEEGLIKPGDDLVFVGFGGRVNLGFVRHQVERARGQTGGWLVAQHPASGRLSGRGWRSMWKRAIRRVYNQVLPVREEGWRRGDEDE